MQLNLSPLRPRALMDHIFLANELGSSVKTSFYCIFYILIKQSLPSSLSWFMQQVTKKGWTELPTVVFLCHTPNLAIYSTGALDQLHMQKIFHCCIRTSISSENMSLLRKAIKYFQSQEMTFSHCPKSVYQISMSPNFNIKFWLYSFM